MIDATDAALAPRTAADELVDATLRGGETIWLHITTRSMLPTFAPGDQIRARGLRADKPRVGEILLARASEHWVAHRLVAQHMENGKILWTTQGDNCAEPDFPWSSEQIRGIINAVKRDGRVANLKSDWAHAAGVVIALLPRSRAHTATSHRASAIVPGALVYATARIAQWIIGFK